jgi:hypothetical protein
MYLEWVEVVLLNRVRSRDFTSFIDVFVIKHLVVLEILNNVSCFLVFQVTPLIDRTPSFVNIIACLILQHNIIFIEVPLFFVRRALHYWFRSYLWL